MRTSLIITTYNRPDALRLVLRSALAQTVLPDEIIIADDGSDQRTEEVIAALQAESPLQLHHVWQEDQGFRAARIRSKGMPFGMVVILSTIPGTTATASAPKVGIRKRYQIIM